MFTGLIEELGTTQSFEPHAGGARLVVSAFTITRDIAVGDSIAVNGVCLTAVKFSPSSITADLSEETLMRTTLSQLNVGSKVNLERAVTPSTRLGGHIVQGHVDGRGTFISAAASGEFRTIRIGFPIEIGKYIVFKGSIAVEGISLTVAALGDDYFDVAIIPKTWEKTNLHSLRPGDNVNLEADIIAKYVERMAYFAPISND